MKIKNLTSYMKKIRLENYVGGFTYDIYIEPHGMTEVEEATIINLDNIIDSILIENVENSTTLINSPSITEHSECESSESEKLLHMDDIVSSDQKTLTDKFICSFCGAEYASQRGLDSHLRRSHAE